MNLISVIIPLAPDRDLEILDSYKKHKNKIKLIIERGTNPSENRNRGIKKTKTELVAFLNAHTLLTDDWAEKVNEFFKKHRDIDIVGGPMLTKEDDPLFERASGYVLSSIFGAGEVRTRYKMRNLNLKANEKHLTSANLICRKKVFKKIWFDETLWPGEDPKFISDALQSGFKVAYSPEIYVYQKRRANFKELFKQIFNYGFTRTRKEKFKETLKKPLFLAPSIFIVYLALLPTLTLFHYFLFFPLILYILLNILFSFLESIKNKNAKSLILTPFLFFIVHLAYGTGFIYGTITKISSNK